MVALNHCRWPSFGQWGMLGSGLLDGELVLNLFRGSYIPTTATIPTMVLTGMPWSADSASLTEEDPATQSLEETRSE